MAVLFPVECHWEPDSGVPSWQGLPLLHSFFKQRKSSPCPFPKPEAKGEALKRLSRPERPRVY